MRDNKNNKKVEKHYRKECCRQGGRGVNVKMGREGGREEEGEEIEGQYERRKREEGKEGIKRERER